MSTPTHYSVPGLVYHHLSLNQPHPHSIPDSSHPHPSFTPDMSWRQSHHSPSQSISSQMQPLIQQPQDHVPDYAAQQSFIARHTTDVYSNHPPSSSVDPGPSSHSISFDSPQIDSSIGPDRVLRTRRVRLPERVQSHGEQLSEYPAISQSYTVRPPFALFPSSSAEYFPICAQQPQNPSSYVPHTQQGSRPHTPAPQTIYTLTGDVPDDVSLSNPDPFLEGLAKRRGGDGYEWRVFYPPGSRSASGSAASASSNPRSASPALSVASALTSVSSSASMPPCPPCQEGFPSTTALLRKEPTRKKRLWNIDRYNICKYAELHPGTKQEDIAARYGVERSTVSKILKQKARWLHVSPEETVLVAKLRYRPLRALHVSFLRSRSFPSTGRPSSRRWSAGSKNGSSSRLRLARRSRTRSSARRHASSGTRWATPRRSSRRAPAGSRTSSTDTGSGGVCGTATGTRTQNTARVARTSFHPPTRMGFPLARRTPFVSTRLRPCRCRCLWRSPRTGTGKNMDTDTDTDTAITTWVSSPRRKTVASRTGCL
ncbi:hypothetical protein C8Q80DRAFT_422513 [Daedaleopsis nitida]|nr:hypothetical protein C8Q80DRAFT_422513 [Daedaleopsis nitida]